ncbi:MAG: hypothetical protein AAF927_03190 [Bacteroidota bacterium]
MNLESFRQSLSAEKPPAGLNRGLIALWYDGKGDWERAHDIAQDDGGNDGDWIHAYLHRKEGDNWNANYWYRRAGKQMPDMSLAQEWESIVSVLLRRTLN